MSKRLVINDQICIPRSEIKFTFSRSPGPGGQNVNKVNSKATLHWSFAECDSLPDHVKLRMAKLFARRINDAGEIVLSSSRTREQRRNLDDCLEKLRQLVQAACVVPRKRKKLKKSAAATARRLNDKRARSQRKTMRKPPRIDD